MDITQYESVQKLMQVDEQNIAKDSSATTCTGTNVRRQRETDKNNEGKKRKKKKKKKDRKKGLNKKS